MKGLLFQEEIQRIGDVIGLIGKFLVDWGCDDIIRAAGYDPRPPKTETVTVERWAVMAPSGYCEDTFACFDTAQMCLENIFGGAIIKLTGSYEVPVKPKVKHREAFLHCDFSTNINDYPPGAKFFAEWES